MTYHGNIRLFGKSGAGKDTLFRIIKKTNKYQNVKMATFIKRYAAIYGFNMKTEANKEQYRKFLQDVSEKMKIKTSNENIWVDSTKLSTFDEFRQTVLNSKNVKLVKKVAEDCGFKEVSFEQLRREIVVALTEQEAMLEKTKGKPIIVTDARFEYDYFGEDKNTLDIEVKRSDLIIEKKHSHSSEKIQPKNITIDLNDYKKDGVINKDKVLEWFKKINKGE